MQLRSETLRDGPRAAQLDEGYATMRAGWTRPVEVCRDAGLPGGDVVAGPTARTMIATAQGFIVREALFGDVHPETLESGLRGLMPMGPQKPS